MVDSRLVRSICTGWPLPRGRVRPLVPTGLFRPLGPVRRFQAPRYPEPFCQLGLPDPSPLRSAMAQASRTSTSQTCWCSASSKTAPAAVSTETCRLWAVSCPCQLSGGSSRTMSCRQTAAGTAALSRGPWRQVSVGPSRLCLAAPVAVREPESWKGPLGSAPPVGWCHAAVGSALHQGAGLAECPVS